MDNLIDAVCFSKAFVIPVIERKSPLWGGLEAGERNMG